VRKSTQIPQPFSLASVFGRSRRSLLSDLRRGIAGEELELVYQPKVELRTWSVSGVEALVRWRHPQRGLLSPAEFLPAAEASDLMPSLTTAILDTALSQARAWEWTGRPLGVAVNLSPVNLLDPGLARHVEAGLAHHGLVAGSLTLEITETAVLVEPDRAVATLRDISSLGVRISLDDFGTGHSSLSRLLQLPIDELKVDREFVRNMRHGGSDTKVVRAIVGLAHDLGHTVVAEGVEDADALARLAELTCDHAQGHHICRPVGAPELSGWLASWEAARDRKWDHLERGPASMLQR
jgi:EAL domain-containing protein (putative c-di-GMP-specific phosphodiesterase class I)